MKPGIPLVETYDGDRTTMPGWVKEGQNVAIVCRGWSAREDTISFRPVKRVTAKFVTVEGPGDTEDRFSLQKGLERAGERGAYSPKYFLADPNSDAVRFARQEARIRNLATKAHQECNHFARKVTPETALAAEEALRAYRIAHDIHEKAQDAYLAAQEALKA